MRRLSAIRIQKVLRGNRCRSQHLRCLSSVETLQRFTRSSIRRIRLARHLSAVISMQSMYRARKLFVWFLRAFRGTLLLQRVVRTQ